MKFRSLFFSFFLISLLIVSCGQTRRISSEDNSGARNIIFLIGDGMGIPAVYAAMAVSDRPLNFERFTYTGFQKTNSADNFITDSAAGGTALSSGVKTNNGVIGMDPSGKPLKSILVVAEEHGLSTGLVSTSAITHATPASFIAHNPDRDNYEDIAKDFLNTDIDVFIGGGYAHFARRSDKLNLIDSLRARGYQVDTTLISILGSKASKIAGFTTSLHNPYRLRGRGDMLPQATAKAIELLGKNKKGFFLMVEGSQIDWAAHANDTESLIDETLDFDKTVGVALDFAKKDGNTLVVVTADHETGGVTLSGIDKVTRKLALSFSSKDHTPVMVPVFAFGPGADKFTGIQDNTSFYSKFLSALGFNL